MAERRRYIFWGSAGHARVLSDIVARLGGEVVALFDNDPAATTALAGVACHIGADGFEHWIAGQPQPTEIHGLAAIGGARGRDRLAIHALFRLHGLTIEPLVHPAASVCRSASLGAGTQVLATAVVAADTRTGEACIVNHGAIADHECRLGNGVHLAPGAVLCGCVTTGDNVLVGAGAVVLPRIRIGSNTIIGAGAVVTRDVPDGVVVTGNPARISRKTA